MSSPLSSLANGTNPWAPAEDGATLLAERAWLQGVVVSSFAYGVEFVLFCICFYLLFQKRQKNSFRSISLIAYICVIFILGTLFMGSLAKFTQLAFIDDRNFPGGPNAFENIEFAIPIDEIDNVTGVLAVWFCDAIIVWRCMVIYQGCRFPIWAVMSPFFVIYLASLTVGTLWLIQVSDKSPFIATAVNWTIPYFAISLSLNVLVTIAIVSRLMMYRRRISSVLGSSHGSQYTSVAAMVVESASVYSAFSIVFLVFLALNSPLSSIFLQSLCQVQISATLLIIFRVASGKGWNSHSRTTFTDIGTGLGTSGSGSMHRPETGYHMNKVSTIQLNASRSVFTKASSLTAIDGTASGMLPSESKMIDREAQSISSVEEIREVDGHAHEFKSGNGGGRATSEV